MKQKAVFFFLKNCNRECVHTHPGVTYTPHTHILHTLAELAEHAEHARRTWVCVPKRRETDKQQAAALGHYKLSADGSVIPIHDDGMSV
jgi:predicted metal-dependent enzyme (double-stranded beta helix superfamily)